MPVSLSSLQAAAGRLLTSGETVSWEPGSRFRCVELVRAFQQKRLDPAGLEAALAGERAALGRPPSAQGTAVLELTGVLTPHDSIFTLVNAGTSVRTFMQQLTAASVDKAIRSIVIVVDSPGGFVALVPEAAALVRAVRGRKPVAVTVAGLNASAAYWITSGATALEATPSALVGAIGVLTERASIAKLLERAGVDVEVFSAGTFKAEGHEALPITDPERRAIQARVDAAYSAFVADVAAGRSVLPVTVRQGFGEGRVVPAADAVRLGMIDHVAIVEDTIQRAVTAPAQFSAHLAARLARSRTAAQAEQAQRARAEIAAHRQTLTAAAGRRAGRLAPTD